MKEHVLAGHVYKCDCGGPVKPDVILFGENLPGHFHTEVNKIAEADLVIVSGTSLKVYPFAFLVQLIPKNVPVVVINFDNPIQKGFDNLLFIQGDIEAHFTILSEEIFTK